MPYITLPVFKARANITDSTQDTYITWVLTNFSSAIDRLCHNAFSLQSNQTIIKYGWGNGLDFVSIGAWQETGLTISYSVLGQTTPTLLVKDSDYHLVYPSGFTSPVIGIKLFSYRINTYSYLSINGTKGWSSTLPSDLETVLYYSALTAVVWNRTQGKGLIESDKIQDVATKFRIPDEYIQHASALAAGDLLAPPQTKSIIYSYILATGEEVLKAI